MQTTKYEIITTTTGGSRVQCHRCRQDYPVDTIHFCPTAINTQLIYVVGSDGQARPVYQP